MGIYSTLLGYSHTSTAGADAFDSNLTPNTNVASPLANLGSYAVAINGRSYAVDTSFEPYRREAFRHRTIPAQRQSINMTNISGQGTINTEGLWRREQTDWTAGAGQIALDRRNDSQENRFFQSKGVDAFSSPYQLTLLNDTTKVYTSSSGTVLNTRCGIYNVVVDGTAVKYTSAWATTPITITWPGSTPAVVNSICSNDTFVYVATDIGLFYAQPGTSNFALYASNDITTGYIGGYDIVRWCNDQLISSRKNRLYAFQPRSSSTYPFFGNPPSISDTSVKIASIVGTGTTATITTNAAHGFTAGQPVTVVNSRTQYYLGGNTATGIALNSGIATATTVSTINGTTAATHGLQVGESIYISGNNHAACNGTFTVLNVPTASTFTFNVNDNVTASGVGNTGGTVLGDTQSGFNVPYSVATAPTTTTFTVSSTVTDAIGAIGGTAVSSNQPDKLYDHNNANWRWSDATGGATQVYFTGYVLNGPSKYSGCVYRSNLMGSSTTTTSNLGSITNSAAATPWNLNTPIQALPMSPDEYPLCIESYLNFIFIGTNKGIRMCQTLSIYDPTATASGDLKSGPLIPNLTGPSINGTATNPSPGVTAIVGDGRYVWFSWSNYDVLSTGLGKLDLSTFINGDPLTPVYASDLMATAQGVVTSLDWDPINNGPVFSVQNSGVYAMASTYVPSGSINSGRISYGVPDNKIPVFFEYSVSCPAGTTVSGSLALDPNEADDTATLGVGSVSNNSVSEITITPGYRAEQFVATIVLASDSTHTKSPTLFRWTLKAWPAVASETMITPVLQLFSVNSVDGYETFVDPYALYMELDNLRRNQTIVTYQEGSLTANVVVVAIDWLPHKRRGGYENGFEGDAVVTLNTIGGYTYTSTNTI